MASTYLTRTNSSAPTNANKATMSVWIKLSKILSSSDDIGILGTNDPSAYNVAGATQIGFYNGGFYVWLKNSSGTYYKEKSTRLLRDPHGWYHIVVRLDSTQASGDNRIKAWINNEEVTAWDNINDLAQNTPVNVNGQNDIRIGRYTFTGGTHNYFDGCMSHFHLCDGQTYSPTDFGETDSTTGEWKIKANPSLTYGTNGFWILKDGNSVTDSSSNSNAFSVGGGTLTNTEDCPSNVFCTANPLSKGSDTVLTNGNTTARNDTSNNSNTLGTIAFGNGKYYFEGYRHGGGNIGIGVCLASADGTTHSSVEAGRVLYYENGTIFCEGLSDQSNISTGVTYADTDKISVSMDTENGILKFYKNDTLVTYGTITNSKFTNAENLWVPHTYQNNGGEWRLNFGNGYFGTTAVSSAGTNASNNGIFEYDVKPSDATALSTKGLNK